MSRYFYYVQFLIFYVFFSEFQYNIFCIHANCSTFTMFCDSLSEFLRLLFAVFKTVLPSLFVIGYHLEVLCSRHIPPGSRETQFYPVSVYSQVEHSNELTTKA